KRMQRTTTEVRNRTTIVYRSLGSVDRILSLVAVYSQSESRIPSTRKEDLHVAIEQVLATISNRSIINYENLETSECPVCISIFPEFDSHQPEELLQCWEYNFRRVASQFRPFTPHGQVQIYQVLQHRRDVNSSERRRIQR
ncbi:hypothetical protein PMAYCL1PPCAC_27974, partial [Pristionchus mayeri]